MDNDRYLLHTCTAGETFDSIAFEYYTDELLATVIMAANKDLCDTLIFEGGEVLLVPVIEEDEETPGTLPPWRA